VVGFDSFGNRQPDGLAFDCRTNGGMLQMKLEVAQRMFSLMELGSSASIIEQDRMEV